MPAKDMNTAGLCRLVTQTSASKSFARRRCHAGPTPRPGTGHNGCRAHAHTDRAGK